MPVADEEVQAARERVDSLREAVAEEKAKQSQMAYEGINEYQKETLDNEAASLEAELAALREANDPEVLAELRQVGTGPKAPAEAAPEPGEGTVPTTPASASGTLGGVQTGQPSSDHDEEE